jgi:hypothetical protein
VKIALVVVALLVVAVVALIVLRRGGEQGRVGSYGDVRSELIGELADSKAQRPPPPPRPAGLDTRLDPEVGRRLRALGAPSEANWKEVCPVYFQILKSIEDELTAIDPETQWVELLSPGRRAVALAEALDAEVNNGGFDQYFVNSSGDWAAATPGALRMLGREDIAAMVDRANAQFPAGPPAARGARLAQMDRLPPEARKVWDELDGQYYELKDPFGGIAASAIAYILAHEAEFFRAP